MSGAPVREHEGEPVRGLPERLPPGEAVLWQGAPLRGALMRRAFRLPALALYFGLLAAWRAGAMLADGSGAADAALGAALVALLGAVPIGFLALFAALVARGALYTITDRRVVLRVGVALPMTVNLPFGSVASAGARVRADGTGDIVLGLLPTHRASFIALWPHARPWRFARPEPMLRAVPDAARVGALLGRALAAHAARQGVPAVPVEAAPAPAPVGQPAPRPAVAVAA